MVRYKYYTLATRTCQTRSVWSGGESICRHTSIKRQDKMRRFRSYDCDNANFGQNKMKHDRQDKMGYKIQTRCKTGGGGT